LLKEYYENETGVAVQDTPTPPPAAQGTPGASPNATRH